MNIFESSELKEMVSALNKMKDNLNIDTDRLNVTYLENAIKVLSSPNYYVVHMDRSYVWDESDAQHSWVEAQLTEGLEINEIKPLSESQLENVFMFLNENEDLNREVSNVLTTAVQGGASNFKTGDEVLWTDPDEGKLTTHAKVIMVRFGAEETIYSLLSKDGVEIEALEGELS